MWSLLSKGPSVVFVSTVLRCWLGCWVLARTTLGLQLNACKSYGIVSSFGPGSTVRFGTPFWLILARKVWQWIGHVLRMPPASLKRSVLLGMQPSEQQRRTRTGPNHSGRNVIRFLAHHDIPLTAAQSRHQWHTLVREPACNVFAIPSDDHLWARKCLQGSDSMASNYLYAKWMVHSNAAWNFTESWAGGNDPSLPFVCETFLLAPWARTGFILAPSTFGFCCFKTLTTIRSPSF